jgi:hypothetical protein
VVAWLIEHAYYQPEISLQSSSFQTDPIFFGFFRLFKFVISLYS